MTDAANTTTSHKADFTFEVAYSLETGRVIPRPGMCTTCHLEPALKGGDDCVFCLAALLADDPAELARYRESNAADADFAEVMAEVGRYLQAMERAA